MVVAKNCCCIPTCPLKCGVFVIGLILTIISSISLLVLICELAGAFVVFYTMTRAGVVYVLIGNIPTLLCGVLCIMATSKNNLKDRSRHLWLLEGAVTSFWVQFVVSVVSFIVMMIVAIVRVDVVVETMAQVYVTPDNIKNQTLTPQLARIILIVDLIVAVIISVAVQSYMLWIVWSYSVQVISKTNVNGNTDESQTEALLDNVMSEAESPVLQANGEQTASLAS